MRILDLFCGAGGAAMGYHQAWPDAEIVGVDIEPQPDYPFTFMQGDALNPPVDLGAFDLIHASPPCQRYSVATADSSKHSDLIEPTRHLLLEAGVPYVMENVVGAPMRRDAKLCGSMFGLDVQRHRLFEVSDDLFFWNQPQCDHDAWSEGKPWTVTGYGGGGKYKHSWKYRGVAHGQELMGMPWVTRKRGLTEAIPPAYTRWIGEQLKGQLDV